MHRLLLSLLVFVILSTPALGSSPAGQGDLTESPDTVQTDRHATLAEAVAATATQEAKFTAADGPGDNEFGWTVSLSGDRALVGVPNDDDNGPFSGSAYVFAFDGTSWSQEAKLLAGDDTNSFDEFGYSVSLEGDRALVGARLDDNAGGTNAGAAYVFAFDGSSWNQEAKLTAADGAVGDRFGRSVSLSGDRALVGAPSWAGEKTSFGAAYVFAFDGTDWAQEAKLTAEDGAQNDFFGGAVSIDGDRTLIGAYQDDDVGLQSGSAYVFAFDGTSWNQEIKLIADDGAFGDTFGFSVSLSGDRALIGAAEFSGFPGSAYVFSLGLGAPLVADAGPDRPSSPARPRRSTGPAPPARARSASPGPSPAPRSRAPPPPRPRSARARPGRTPPRSP